MSITLLGTSQHLTGSTTSHLLIPLFLDSVAAGFPSPAQDYVERTLDLNELCITHPAATFFVRVDGDSMRDAGIYARDILVVDRSLTAKHGDIVIASLDNELTVKELLLKPKLCLMPHNPDYRPIYIQDDAQLDIFGIVVHVVRQLRNKH